MLDANTLQWLGRRKERLIARGVYSNPDRLIEFLSDTLVPDYRDAAEFEARAAEKMATVICGECEEFNKKPNCPISIYQAPGLYECRLKHARLSVEAEMIREGKGPGSPEVK